jgi:nonsense-mediated mRNA decay protein 3
LTQQLISHNEQNSEYNYKYTFIVELAPICRDDLVLLPKNVQREYGGIGPLVLVYKISKFIHIVDINTMQTYEVDRENYWKHPFKAIMGRERLTEFIVIDIENIDTNFNDSRAALKQKFKQIKLEIARKSDFGVNDQTFFVNCHLGELIDYNDTVLGYDIEQANCSEFEEF